MLTILLLPNQFYGIIFVAELLQYNTTVFADGAKGSGGGGGGLTKSSFFKERNVSGGVLPGAKSQLILKIPLDG